MPRPLAAIAALSCAIGCGAPPPPTQAIQDIAPDNTPRCQTGFVGDPSLPPEIEVITYGPDGVSELTDGGSVGLMLPPQGGRVIYVGVRARNVESCSARITGVLRDPETGLVRVDTRSLNLQPQDDGTASSREDNLTSFANIPICPNQWASGDGFDQPYELEVRLRDKDDREVRTTMTVTPWCAEPENEADCRCICKGGYRLGESCDDDTAADGGM